MPDMKLELVLIPVSDVDRAKAFYTEQLGFALDVDTSPTEGFRVVQLTPPGSACSITIGTGLTDAEPGSYRGTHLVVTDIVAAREDLAASRSATCGTSIVSRASGSRAPTLGAASTRRSRTSRIRTATRGSCRRCPRARSRRKLAQCSFELSS